MFNNYFSFRSYSNSRNHNRRSPSSTPSVRSASYHSPTRNSGLNQSQTSGIFVFIHKFMTFFFEKQDLNFFFLINILGISRPSSPATIRHSTNSPSAISRIPQPPTSDQQSSPAHHRANSGPTIAISLFPESDNSNRTSNFSLIKYRDF